MQNKKLVETLQSYLDGTLGPQGTKGGGNNAIPENKEDNNTFLILDLQRIIADNNNWMKYLFAILTAVIVFIAVLIWRWQSNYTILIALLGGQGLSILFCINRITALYNQKRTSEILLHLFNAAKTPGERKKIIQDIVDFLTKKSD